MENILVVLDLDERQKRRLEASCPKASFTFRSPQDDLSAYRDYEVVMGSVPLRKLQAFTRLKWFQAAFAGVEKYVSFLPEDVLLTNASGAYGYAVSQMMTAAVYYFAKRLDQYAKDDEKHVWKYRGGLKDMGRLRVLAVGMGDIGSRFARQMSALGSDVVGIRRVPREKPDYVLYVTSMDHLEEELSRADVVACSLPATGSTYHLMDYGRLSCMKPDAIFLNAGRGSLVVTDDLVRILREGKLGGVWLDVTDPEPLPPGHPLWDLPRVLITPHTAGNFSLYQTMVNVTDIFIENVNRYLSGQALRNVVDRETGYRKTGIS